MDNTNKKDKHFPEAVYNPQEIVEYKGNPLIEALPPILSLGDAYGKMRFEPLYHEKERELSEEIRYHMLFRLQQFFQPVTQHLDLERRISRLIRSGYIARNPLDSKEAGYLSNNNPIVPTSASSFTLMGFSGIGKTSAIEKVLSLYPQVILHKHPINRIQVVWVKLNCPHDGSLKTLCMDFFLKLDEILGTNYLSKYGNPRNSISALVIHMGRIARIHCIGTLIIDEIQHLLTTKDSGSEKMMNFFVTLINEIGIPVILIGTMKAKAVLQKDFRQARRGSGQGDMVWEQMKFDDDWKMMIEEMWKYQWTSIFTPLTDELMEVLYKESQGILDIAVKLFSLAQSRAIETGNERITPKAIKQVGNEDLKLVQPMLKALRTGRESEIIKYEDITPMDLKEFLELRKSKIDLRASIQKKKDEQERQKKEFEVSQMEKAIHALITLGVDANDAEKAVRIVLKEPNVVNSTDIMVKALNQLEMKKKNKESQLKMINETKSENLLAKIIEKGKKDKKSAYEILLEQGYIGSPVDEFII
ncbi:ATP-binding protein [Neobacillus sp. PS2-9]|uniref:ATP-binding protein n=1 Tax=Neobacillus sp. PS2-9 TaxID=3070676 RepID=UPI0027E11C06|nr:ATP-binding protein [Neobacillus sp. PS2-9]WML58110.1 ATP-binding protein [Neobacillus sp. PS2-9]